MIKNPSTKNGYVPLANELLEVLAKAVLTGHEWRLLLVVIRETWGWVEGDRRRDEAEITISTFSKKTGMARSNVCRGLKRLIASDVLVTSTSDPRVTSKTSKKSYKINQNYAKWSISWASDLAVTSPASDLQVTKLVTCRTQTSDPEVTSLLVKERKKERNTLRCSDSDFISSLKTNPAYAGIDIDRELGKMDAWLLTKPGRQKTRAFIVNWLNKIDKPLVKTGRATI